MTVSPDEIRTEAFDYYDRLRRVRRFVERHHVRCIPLTEAASVAHLESTYFSKFFHSKVGVRFSDWVAYVRVEEAKRLFREGNRSVTRVGYEVGFRNLRTFERTFKRVTGQTPGAFKRTVAP